MSEEAAQSSMGSMSTKDVVAEATKHLVMAILMLEEAHRRMEAMETGDLGQPPDRHEKPAEVGGKVVNLSERRKSSGPKVDPRQLSLPSTAGKPVVRLEVLQERLVGIIDEHFDELKDSIDTMGCKGDCYLCPTPDFPKNIEKQVLSCLSTVKESLGIPDEKDS